MKKTASKKKKPEMGLAVTQKTLQKVSAATELAAVASKLKVTNQQSLTYANTLLIQIKEARTELVAHRDRLVKPLKDHIKSVEATYFKPGLGDLDNADEILRDKVLSYRAVLAKDAARIREEAEARVMEAEAAAQEALKEGDKKGAQEALQLAQEAALEVAETTGPGRTMAVGDTKVSARSVMDFKIVDLALIPDHYKVVDPKLIRAAIRSGITRIPGVEIFETEILAVGGL